MRGGRQSKVRAGSIIYDAPCVIALPLCHGGAAHCSVKDGGGLCQAHEAHVAAGQQRTRVRGKEREHGGGGVRKGARVRANLCSVHPAAAPGKTHTHTRRTPHSSSHKSPPAWGLPAPSSLPWTLAPPGPPPPPPPCGHTAAPQRPGHAAQSLAHPPLESSTPPRAAPARGGPRWCSSPPSRAARAGRHRRRPGWGRGQGHGATHLGGRQRHRAWGQRGGPCCGCGRKRALGGRAGPPRAEGRAALC